MSDEESLDAEIIAILYALLRRNVSVNDTCQDIKSLIHKREKLAFEAAREAIPLRASEYFGGKSNAKYETYEDWQSRGEK